MKEIKPKALCLTFEWFNTIKTELSHEEIGRLMTAAFEYAETGKDIKFEDKYLRIIWNGLKNIIDNNNEKYVRAVKNKQGQNQRYQEKIKNENKDEFIKMIS